MVYKTKKWEVVNDMVNEYNVPINDTIKQLLFDAISKTDGLKRGDLAKAVNKTNPTVARLLAVLEHENKIV